MGHSVGQGGTLSGPSVLHGTLSGRGVGHSVTGVGHSVVRKSSYEAAFAANDLKIAAAI